MGHDHDHPQDHDHEQSELGEMDLRVRALETVLTQKGYVDPAALDAAREITHVPEVLPRIIADGGGMRIVLPGDPSYDGPQAVPDASVDWMGLAAAGPVTGFEAEGSP